MNRELAELVDQLYRDRMLRDGGIEARKTWAEIKGIASSDEQISILEGIVFGKK